MTCRSHRAVSRESILVHATQPGTRRLAGERDPPSSTPGWCLGNHHDRWAQTGKDPRLLQEQTDGPCQGERDYRAGAAENCQPPADGIFAVPASPACSIA